VLWMIFGTSWSPFFDDWLVPTCVHTGQHVVVHVFAFLGSHYC
jgi:hypothetical protein